VTAVAHYLERWLDISAGFVAMHVDHSRYDGVVISRDGWRNLEAFDYRPRHSLHGIRRITPDRIKPLVLRAHLATILAARRVDLVHVHFGYAAADVLAATRRRPYVLSLHGHDVTGLLSGDPDRYRSFSDAVDAVVVPSRYLAAAAIDAGFTSEQIRVIPSGVDTEFFTPAPLPDGPPVIGYVGRLVEKKGIDTLMAAWPAIAAAAPNARLQMLGDGPLQQLVPTDDERISLAGPDPTRRGEQVRDLIRQATVVVTPSHPGSDGDSESLLLVNLEAAASGRPVVSTRHGGIPEYVDDGTTGLLVQPGDPAALSAAVIRLLHDRRLAQSLATAATANVQRWDSHRCAARVDDLYDELLRARRGVK
jgi:colanic acid/amylovoran biosynthesis glycosyltransferase